MIVTKNFKRWSIDDFFYTDPNQYRMHSDALVTTERLTWKDAKTIAYRITLDDPKIFTQPWGQDFTIAAKPEWSKDGLYEYVCEENNRRREGSAEEANKMRALLMLALATYASAGYSRRLSNSFDHPRQGAEDD